MLYRFGDYTLDAQERTLCRSGSAVELTPKVFQTLLVLVQNHDRIMSKDELLSTIWPHQIVEEANITQNISVLRRALGEAASGRKYIATFQGRGYRFLEPVALSEKRSYPPEDAAPRVPAAAFPTVADQEPAAQPGGRRPRRLAAAVALLGTISLISTAWLISRHIRHVQAAPPPQQQSFSPVAAADIHTVARMDGAQYEPSWSPDGRKLAFTYLDRRNSQSSLFVWERGAIQPRRVVGGSGRYSSPVFSPDGRSLAFVHIGAQSAEIVILDLASMKSRRLTSLFPHRYGLNFRDLDWSPSGDLLVVSDKAAEGDPFSLYLVSAGSGRRIRLTFPNMDILGDVSPRFSPDGNKVAFLRLQYQYQFDVFALPVTGGVPLRLTRNSRTLGDVGWASSNDVVFSGDHKGEFSLWQVSDRTGHRPPELTGAFSTDMPLQFAISRSTHQIAFSGYRPDLNIWSLDLDPKTPAALRWTPEIQSPGQDIAPVFSPDGSRIAYRSDNAGPMQIWVSHADGTQAAPLNTGSLVPGVHCWTPDSRTILFSARTSPGLFEIAADGSGTVRRIASLHVSHPFVSLDGKWIFARSRNFIYRIPAAGGAPEMLTDQGGAPMMESRDGRYLYFGGGRMDTTVMRLDLQTRKQELVIRSLIPGYRDCWTITGDGILFLTEEAGKPVIEYRNLTTRAERKIADFPGPLPPVATSGFSLSPDGRRLLIVRAEPAFAGLQTESFTPAENAGQ